MASKPRKRASQSCSFMVTAKEMVRQENCEKGQSVNSLFHKMTGTYNEDQKNKQCSRSKASWVLPTVK